MAGEGGSQQKANVPAMADDDKVELMLTQDEALVLFDFLLRLNEQASAPLADVSEKFVLWGVECLLEQQLSAAFSPDYPRLLAEARTRVRESY